VKRCSVCQSVNVRRSGVPSAEARAHPFHSPYRCDDCSSRFWVISRRVRIGALSSAILLTMALAVAAPLILLKSHRSADAAAHSTSSAPADPALPASSTLDDVIAGQNDIRRLSNTFAPAAGAGASQ